MFAIIAAVLAYQLLAHDRAGGAYAGVELSRVSESTVVGFGNVLFLASLAVLALSVLFVLVPSFADRPSRSRLANVTSDALLWVSLLLTAAAIGYGLIPRAQWVTTGALPGYAPTVTELFAAQVVLLSLLMLVVLVQRRRARHALFAGFGAPILASLGLGMGAAFSAAVSFRVADLLDGSAVPSPAEFSAELSSDRLQPPVSYQWAALGFVLMLVLTIVVGLVVWFVVRPVLRRRARPGTDSDFPGRRTADRTRAASIDRAVATATLTDHVSGIFGIFWFILALLGLGVTALALGEVTPVEFVGAGTPLARVVSVMTNIGTYLISLTAVLLVLLGVQTYRNQRVRSTVGIVWDVATFWPRSAHPLAPPCYAERAVPELVNRATWLAMDQGGVILSGHSQGSVLVAASVLQLPPAARLRTALLTYGSPLARLYQRAFPKYFNDNVLRDIAQTVAGADGGSRWVNLWRRTDPIGGPVGIGDRRLADPSSFDPLPGDRLAPAPSGHSGYQLTPQFGRAVDDLLGLLGQVSRGGLRR
jgi:hypothetical protein